MVARFVIFLLLVLWSGWLMAERLALENVSKKKKIFGDFCTAKCAVVRIWEVVGCCVRGHTGTIRLKYCCNRNQILW